MVSMKPLISPIVPMPNCGCSTRSPTVKFFPALESGRDTAPRAFGGSPFAVFGLPSTAIVVFDAMCDLGTLLVSEGVRGLTLVSPSLKLPMPVMTVMTVPMS